MKLLGVFSFALLATPMRATAAEGDESGMIQAKMQHRPHDELDDHNVGRPHWKTLRPYSVSKNACIAANAAASMYGGSAAEFFNKANPDFDSFKEYNITVQGKYWGNATEDPRTIKGDTDKAWFFRKRTRCWITFMGSDSMSDFVNNANTKPIEKWGIKGVHAGVASELEGLVDQMSDDFGLMRKCSQLRVAGHSLGGGLAQLFTLALNKEGDPLKAGLKVKELFTFGAMSAVVDTVGNNDKRSDKCFRGEQYYYADEVNGTIYADVVANALIGGTLYDPLRSKKRLLTPTATGAKLKSFKCGKPLPTSLQSLQVKDCHHPMVACDAWNQKHMSYASLLGCRKCTGDHCATCSAQGYCRSCKDGYLLVGGKCEAMTPATSSKWCGEQCKAKDLCCNDPKVGSNQMISCAQACLMRSQGVAQTEMLSSAGGICNRTGQSGCRLESKMKNSFSFCNRCSDLTDKCPHGVKSASECDAGASLWTFKTEATDTFVTTTTTTTPFFLAQGGQSCTAACQAASKTCDAERLTQAASSVHKCKLIIESLGKTPTEGGQYADDNSGCTYHPGQTGWYQVMRKNGDTECDAVNSDRSRQRVCACN